jgi:hypothetical protein
MVKIKFICVISGILCRVSTKTLVSTQVKMLPSLPTIFQTSKENALITIRKIDTDSK